MKKYFLLLILSLGLMSEISIAQNQKATTKGAEAGFQIPSGVIMPYAGATAPSGWAFAYGQEVSQTSATYKNLYTAISTTYCTAEHGGTCTGGNFRLPDLRGRSIHGKDNMGGTAASRITTGATIDGTVLGKSGGSQTVTLCSSNIPQVSTSYTPTGGVPAGSSHYHQTAAPIGQNGNTVNSFLVTNTIPGTIGFTSTSNGSYVNLTEHFNTGSEASHTHPFNGNAATITVGSGSPSAVNNLTPTTIMNYIIKL